MTHYQSRDTSDGQETGQVVEVPHRQYRIRMIGSGKLSLRNCKFLKNDHAKKQTSQIDITYCIPQAVMKSQHL